MTDAPVSDRLKQLRYRAWHRGFREADLILGPFAERVGGALSDAELVEFERLLDQPDQALYAWITEQESVPPEFDGAILGRLRAFLDEVGAALSEGAGPGWGR